MADNDRSARMPVLEEEAPQTAARFPHIIERLKTVWADPSEGPRFFQSLLVDERGNRQGFPMPILLEIMHLHDLFQATGGSDEGGDTWSSHESML